MADSPANPPNSPAESPADSFLTSPPISSPPSDDSPFDHVVDDYAPKAEALEWAIDQFTAGQTYEAIAQHLTESGWSEDDTDDIAETARRQTRDLRGGVTRDQVVRSLNRQYRQSMSGRWFTGFPVWAAAIRLIHSIKSLLSLGRIGSKTTPTDGPSRNPKP